MPQDLTPKNNTYIFLAVARVVSQNEKTGLPSIRKRYFSWVVHTETLKEAEELFHQRDDPEYPPYILLILCKFNGDTHEKIVFQSVGLALDG